MLQLRSSGAVWDMIMDLCYQDPYAGGLNIGYREAMEMNWDEFKFYLHSIHRIRERVYSKRRKVR